MNIHPFKHTASLILLSFLAVWRRFCWAVFWKDCRVSGVLGIEASIGTCTSSLEALRMPTLLLIRSQTTSARRIVTSIVGSLSGAVLGSIKCGVIRQAVDDYLHNLYSPYFPFQFMSRSSSQPSSLVFDFTNLAKARWSYRHHRISVCLILSVPALRFSCHII